MSDISFFAEEFNQRCYLPANSLSNKHPVTHKLIRLINLNSVVTLNASNIRR